MPSYKNVPTRKRGSTSLRTRKESLGKELALKTFNSSLGHPSKKKKRGGEMKKELEEDLWGKETEITGNCSDLKKKGKRSRKTKRNHFFHEDQKDIGTLYGKGKDSPAPAKKKKGVIPRPFK